MVLSAHSKRMLLFALACLLALPFSLLPVPAALAVSLDDIQGTWVPDAEKNWKYNEEEVPADFDLLLLVTQNQMEWLDEAGESVAIRTFTVRATSAGSITLAFAAETISFCSTTGETFLVRLDMRGADTMDFTLLLENGMADFTLFYSRASAATE